MQLFAAFVSCWHCFLFRPHRSTAYVDRSTAMRSIVRDRVAWSVGLSVTLVSPDKTAEPIEMPFGLRTRVGPGNHVLDGGPDPPHGKGQFWGKGAPIVKYRDSAVTCAKIAEPIVMQFGLWARSASRNHEKDGVPISHEKG